MNSTKVNSILAQFSDDKFDKSDYLECLISLQLVSEKELLDEHYRINESKDISESRIIFISVVKKIAKDNEVCSILENKLEKIEKKIITTAVVELNESATDNSIEESEQLEVKDIPPANVFNKTYFSLPELKIVDKMVEFIDSMTYDSSVNDIKHMRKELAFSVVNETNCGLAKPRAWGKIRQKLKTNLEVDKHEFIEDILDESRDRVVEIRKAVSKQLKRKLLKWISSSGIPKEDIQNSLSYRNEYSKKLEEYIKQNWILKYPINLSPDDIESLISKTACQNSQRMNFLSKEILQQKHMIDVKHV
eukprot:gb/GECH01010143.1/.p1 GENE.gb/GECH01010143.1/~~gb/GECH01010143.1/.p1  ORF type:complete len:306 (+),score=30.80 gb/GECH01010143.1/:1-918(+)